MHIHEEKKRAKRNGVRKKNTETNEQENGRGNNGKARALRVIDDGKVFYCLNIENANIRISIETEKKTESNTQTLSILMSS